MDKKRCRVTFAQYGKNILVAKGTSILEAAEACGIEIEAPCTGAGTCEKCKVRICSDGSSSDSLHLACTTKVFEDVKIDIPKVSRASLKILEKGLSTEVKCNPNIEKIALEVPKPSLEFNRADLERLKMVLPASKKNCEITLQLIRELPFKLRNSDHKVTGVFAGSELIEIEEGDTSKNCFGVALDVGTTSVVASLVDLCDKKELALASSLNGQNIYGQDVISRITYTKANPDGLRKLQKEIIQTTNKLIKEVCQKTRVKTKNIYEICVTGNTCMLHLFLGLDPTILASAPYAAIHQNSLSLKAGELSVKIAPRGKVYLLPNISAFVGADIISGILATNLSHQKEPTLFIDIGTNGEIVLSSADGLVACSTAAGPAFEGMNISGGMRAEAGAIEEVRLDDDIYFRTVDDASPAGICGSGLIDLVAELLKKGIVDNSGRLLAKLESGGSDTCELRQRVNKTVNGVGFLLVDKSSTVHSRDISLTQKDIREVQLAKGAISAGIKILLKELNLSENDISQVFVAGAFGYHVRPESLQRIGLIPLSLIDKVTFVGNSAKTGAEMVLLNREARETASSISRKVKTIELTTHPDFEKEFVKAMSFPTISPA